MHLCPKTNFMKQELPHERLGTQAPTLAVPHPGNLLNDELKARHVKKIDFAKQLGVAPSELSELLKGRRHVNAKSALKLEKLLEIPAEYWLGSQMYFNLEKARKKLDTEPQHISVAK